MNLRTYEPSDLWAVTSFISYRVSLFAGIGIKHAIIDSMFVVIDTSKCPTRLDYRSYEFDLDASSSYIVAIV